MSKKFRVLSTIAVVLVITLHAYNAFAGGVVNNQVSPIASIQSFKLKQNYASTAEYETARRAACASSGVRCPALGLQDIFFDTTANTWKRHTGSAWTTTSAPSTTLDQAYTAGQTIVRDLNPIAVSDATAGSSATMSFNRTAGSGPVLSITNAGTGADLQGSDWSVSTAGVLSVPAIAPATDLNLYSGGGVPRAVHVGYDGTNEVDTDFVLHSGYSTAAVNWYYDVGTLSFPAHTTAFMETDAVLQFGWALSAPHIKVKHDGSKLYFLTGGDGNETIQFGSSAADYRITTQFGNPSFAAVQIDPNATAGTQIEYMTTKPVEHIYLPAAEFGVGNLGSAAWGATDNVMGWLLDDTAGAECVQTTWQAPKWIDTSADISAYVVWAGPAAGDAVVSLQRKGVNPGTTATSLSDSSPDNQTVAVAAQKIEISPEAKKHTIAASVLSTSLGHVVHLQVCRLGSQTADTLVGDLAFIGLDLEVTRKYAD